MSKEHILVLGAGPGGYSAAFYASDQGYKVTVLDNLSSGFINNIDKRSDFIEDSFINLSGDILKNIDCVIHLAALKAAGESMENPIKYSELNIILTKKLTKEEIIVKIIVINSIECSVYTTIIGNY